jgi:hypothetical protein
VVGFLDMPYGKVTYERVEWKVDIVCFQETKLEVMSCSVVYGFVIIWILDSRGALGGILIMWGKRMVEKIAECAREFTLVDTFRNVEDHFTLAFAGVYGHNSDRDRRLL